MGRYRTGVALAAAVAIAGIIAGRGPAQAVGDSPGGQEGAGATAAGGEQVYRQICQACHMPNAEGGSGAGIIPALASNPHLANVDYPISIILKGKGGMPAFAGLLDAKQIAGVVTYVRTHFGNDYKPSATSDDVKRLSQGLPESE